MNVIDSSFLYYKQFLYDWHINFNVLNWAKKHFLSSQSKNDSKSKKLCDEFMKKWIKMICFTTHEEYIDKWTAFQIEHFITLIEYVQDTWLTSHKTRIVWVYMNEYEHFEHHVSLKIESSHHQIKNFIWIFINDISKICD